jgi:flagellar motor switch protein FliG
VEQLTIAIAELKDIEPDMVEDVREEYQELVESKKFILEGGTDYARDLLTQSIGKQRADEVMKKHQYDQGVDAFGLFQSAEMGHIVHFLQNEQPQVAAVILAHLKVDRAAEILCALPDGFQSEIAYRLARMGKISSEVVEELEDIIKDEMSSDYGQLEDILKGSSAVASILNESNIATERRVLEGINQIDGKLAEEIKQQMFLFEDIMELEDRTLQTIIAKLDKNDLTMGMKGIDEELKEKIIDNMSQRASEILIDDLEVLGPVQVNQVEEAQQNIIRTIKELEEEGSITIRKGGGEELVE